MEKNKSHRRFGLKHGLYLVLAMGFITAVAQPFSNKKKPIINDDNQVIAADPLPGSKTTGNKTAADKKREEESANAFMEAYKVLMHPRCMNCHPSGDEPLQGDDSHIHAQNVTRGPDGRGLFALKCSNCHQSENVAGDDMPPGNPNWHLPPANMKMIFQGRTPAQLARQLKDPKQTGKTMKQLLEHVEHDKLVLGGWNPGDGRTKPPLSHEGFAKNFREWIEKGVAIPQ